MIVKERSEYSILLSVLSTLACFLAVEASQAAASCFVSGIRQRLEQSATKLQKIETLDDLLWAFAHGFTPDLSNPSQRNAFEVYRRMRLGDPNTELNPGTMDQIAAALKMHPELEKEPFRNYTLEVQERNYPVTKELASYLDGQIASAGQIRSNLFHIDANSGYWKKVLGYEEQEVSHVEQLAKDASPEQKSAFRERMKRQKEEAKAKWMHFLDSKLPRELRTDLLDPKRSPPERAASLYHVLIKERERMKEEGKDIRPLSQAIIDLIHTIGYNDPALAKALKSNSGLERINAYRKVLDERDRYAMALGYKDHFEQVLRDIGKPTGVTMPSGLSSSSGTVEILNKLEREVIAGSQAIPFSTSKRTIRHLSLVESPYRSCLGGSDCSSRTYLTRALDPNYHYFTITDENGASSGQITVVLGEGKLHGIPVKTAFIDKVQNVPNTDLPLMIEGIRRSFEEKGYKLALPNYLGDHNGISNEDVTMSFIAQNIKRDSNQPIVGFKPHKHSYNFPNEYSRAELSLASHAVAPLKLADDTKITPGELTIPWKAGDFDLNQLVQATVNLKHSPKVEDKIRYISSMKSIKDAELESDPEFESTLRKWMTSEGEPFQLRKRVLLFQWTENSKPLPTLLRSFSPSERIQLLQNLLDTPRYRERILNEKSSIPELIVIARINKKVRENLIGAYTEDKHSALQPAFDRVLDAHDVSDEIAAGLLKNIQAGLGSADISEYLNIQKLAYGMSLESWFRDHLLTSYASTSPNETNLGRALFRSLNSSDAAILNFGQHLLAKFETSGPSQSKMVTAFREITSLQRSNPALGDVTQAAKAWLKSEKVSPELKARFLLTHYGAQYQTYLAAIPHGLLPSVMKKLDELTNLRMFQRLIEKEVGVDEDQALHILFENGKLESFEFQPIKFPEGGKRARLGSPEGELDRRKESEALREVTFTKPFEIQATPVTHLQWALVMGTNPSLFKSGGTILKIHGKDIRMNSNRPVDSVSGNDIQKYIDKLNQMDPHYNYRLPTPDEWEYAARAGTDTPYSFGSDPKDLDAHGWHQANSGHETHDVASLKPNANGLYDMHGNVWEITQEGSALITRGGGWGHDKEHLRSARRVNYGPNSRGSDTGFRLVRTPK